MSISKNATMAAVLVWVAFRPMPALAGCGKIESQRVFVSVFIFRGVERSDLRGIECPGASR